MASESDLRTDLRISVSHHELRPVYAVDSVFRRVPSKTGLFEDLATVTGDDNLAQAVVVRLLTPRGELAALGHPGYGSRLHELIGHRMNPATVRNLLRLHILEALQSEPRVQRVEVVDVRTDRRTPTTVDVSLRVLPARGAPVSIGPLSLEL